MKIADNEENLEMSKSTDNESIISEKLIALKSNENISDSEMEEITNSINIFCSIIYDFLVLSENTVIPNPQKIAA